ncbi:sugar 3,4-ketoisomerase [Rhodoplanes roseus]|uniref:Sugar 3,4-ketoisomerase QdtA cupin domain-containing protein n=1 Tax=Rhodoplanes roseus TaxID=29409 RepID=A0A327KYS4_9BRAD|nr:FdtA/QdtA family cupin domain-containing protein [Rhodoplanes roseus]RAI43256.1 hypothetical protein CH341_15315 [Rhodoplanes roseus]
MVSVDDIAALGGAVALFPVPSRRDARGALHPFDFDALPFVPQRAFVVQPAAAGTTRGGHAHRSARQLLVRLAGVIEIELAVAGREVTVRLDDTGTALLLAPGVWARHTYRTADAQLLVFASEPFDPEAYVSTKDAPAERGP